jgi:hypothetical protein
VALLPPPLVGEGRGGGSGGDGASVPHGMTPTPDPSPQGGGEKKHRRAMSEVLGEFGGQRWLLMILTCDPLAIVLTACASANKG